MVLLVLEKTNVLLDMIFRIYLYAKNLKQSKHQLLPKKFEPIKKEVGYDIIEANNDKLIPVSELTDDNKKNSYI